MLQKALKYISATIFDLMRNFMQNLKTTKVEEIYLV